MTDIVEKLRDYANDDHERLCQGRTYSCSCGYDDKRDPLMTEAADTITALRARVVDLEGQHKGLKLQNALLRQRPDLPVDRIPAADEVTTLRAEVERLTQVALAAERESKYEHFEQHIDRLGDENRELRAENEKLRAALSGVLWMAEEWFSHGGDETTLADDYEKQLEAARAALEEPTSASPAVPPRS